MNWVFITFGFHWNPIEILDNQKIISYGLRIKSSLLIIYFICETSQSISNLKKNLFELSFLIKCCIFLFSFIHFNVNFSKIVETLRQITSNFDEKAKKSSKKFNNILSIIWIIAVIINLIGLIYKDISKGTGSPRLIIESSIWSINCFGWIIATQFLFLSLCHQIYLLERQIVSNGINHHNNQEQTLRRQIQFVKLSKGYSATD